MADHYHYISWISRERKDYPPGAGMPDEEKDMSDTIRASHILIGYSGSASSGGQLTQEDALSSIEGLRAKIEDGADFGDIAREHSDCPSGSKGGDLGSFGRNAMVAPFDEAAFALEVDQLSEVVETEFGYHLIQRTE